MRKFLKKELLGIIKQLDKANEVILKNANALSVAQAVNVLTECQQSAIVVGSKVDEIEGEGTATVTLLEEYCEELYLLSANWEDVKLVDKTAKRIRLLLNKVSNSIQYDLPDSKKEVVFLPYKASMWDSLESVWMAARDDENCDAYVIPIPYFDKNPDGSFREAHYEGDLYPEYVPIVKYDEYDFETRRPDVIYIHNPYDEYNFVTSVHPYFYAKNLKQYTEQLVYVPYFVSTDNIKEDYCVQAGIVYADKVVVQSDIIRNDYIKNCLKVLGKDFNVKKIIAGGSPKFDKLLQIIDSGIEVPESWMEKIKEKKVVLYNTHLNTLLKYERAAIEKIESVFKFFATRNDVVLLWRPHPLSKTTLKAMRPELYELYCDLEQKYRTEEIGIFDDSDDMYPAIYVSDAYYGDSSSVITIFGATGRPICLQNVEVKDNISKGQGFEGVCMDGNVLYFANMEYNALASFDLADGQLKHLGEFPGIDRKQKRITQNIGLWNEKLWMMPFNGEKVYSYDLKTEMWETYPIPEEWPKDCKRNIIFAGTQIGKYYYGFGAGRYGVMRLDMESGEIDYSRNGIEQYKQMITPGKSNLVCRQDCCVVEGKIYVACLAGNLVLEYDTITTKISLHSVGDRNNSYITICYDGNFFWLTEISGKVMKWNPKTKETKEITSTIKDASESGKWAYASSLYADGYVWLFAYCAKENIRINVQTGVVEKVYLWAGESACLQVKVVKSWYADGTVYFVDATKCTLVQMDSITLETKEIKISSIQKNIRWMWESEQINTYRDYLQRESGLYNKNLGGFVDYLFAENLRSERQQRCFLEFTKYPEGNAGEMIHKNMMEKDW